MNLKKGLINNNINKHKMKMVIFRERFLFPPPPSLPRCPYKGRGVISLARWQQRRQITWPTSDSLPVCDLLLQWNREKVSVSIFPYVSVFTGYWWKFWYFFMWMIVLLIRRVYCHLNRNGKQQVQWNLRNIMAKYSRKKNSQVFVLILSMNENIYHISV